jgi:tetratricopeptide (TPR) repeat protein
MDRTSEAAASGLAEELMARGRAAAADEIQRARAIAVRLSGGDWKPLHERRRVTALSAQDVPRALGAALDERLDEAFDAPGEGVDEGAPAGLDNLLLRAGLLEALAARLEIRAERASAPESSAHLYEQLARLLAGPLASPARAASAHASALVADPRSESAVAGLRAYAAASRDTTPLVEALVRVASAEPKDEEVGRLQGRTACGRVLAALAEEELSDPALAMWAFERVLVFAPSDVAAKRGVDRNFQRAQGMREELAAGRKALGAREGNARVEHLKMIALILRGMPDQADALAKILAELAERCPTEKRFAAEATRLAWRLGDLDAVKEHAGAQLADAKDARDRVEARLALAQVARATNNPAAANEATRALLAEAPGDRAGGSVAWANAALAGDERTRALSIAELAASCAGPLQAVLYAVAAEALADKDEDRAAARSIAEHGCQAESQNARCLVVLADIVQGATDRTAASVLERAITQVGARSGWCTALADALDALGEPAAAIGWTQRRVALAPGGFAAVDALLGRLVAAKDAERLADALAWLLSQPQPAKAIAGRIAPALKELGAMDPGHAVVIARRALDVLGPRHVPLREAMEEVAGAARDEAFSAALLERWICAGAPAIERRTLFGALARRFAAAGDADGEARAIARAIRDGADPSDLADRIITLELGDATVSGDGEVAWLEARAELLGSRGERSSAARAFRDLGAALWDLADDRPGAVRAWLRAARFAPHRGYATLGVDLARFADSHYALDVLTELVEREPDRARSGAIAAEAARAALAVGEPGRAFDLAKVAIERNPASTDALEIAEQASVHTARTPQMSPLYDVVGTRALGRFGRRAAHYRGARFFEQRGDSQLAFKHAVEAFAAVPNEGITLVLLARAAERADARAVAVKAVEQVAEANPSPQMRAAWLLRAASLASPGPDGARQRFDVLLRAVALGADTATLALLGDATRALIELLPEERESAEVRLQRAALLLAKKLEGPEGARVALAFGQLQIELFEDPTDALADVTRALELDGDLEEFARFMEHARALGEAQGAKEALAKMVAVATKPYSNVGAAALKVIAEIAKAMGDASARALALVMAVEKEDEDDELIVMADEALRRSEDVPLRERFARRIKPNRLTEALRAVAHDNVEERYDVALEMLERATESASESRMEDLSEELKAVREAVVRVEAEEEAALEEAKSNNLREEERADKWVEVAEAREATGDLAGATDALVEAVRLEPEGEKRWDALERVAELAGRASVWFSALEQVASAFEIAPAITDVQGNLAPPPSYAAQVLKRLARARKAQGHTGDAEKTWRRVLEIAPTDEDADPALERLIAARGDYQELAEQLGRRAERLAKSAGAESQRAVRLRRVAILEQRLGRTEDASRELEQLLEDSPDNEAALAYLADLRERHGDAVRALPLWERLSGLVKDDAERCDIDLRVARAQMKLGNFDDALALTKSVLARRFGDAEAMELRVELARALQTDAELGDAIEDFVAASADDAVGKSDMLVEAAQAAARSGDAVTALERARRAARMAPEHPKAQLFARAIEYRLRGSGAPDEARLTIDALGQIKGHLDVEDAALQTFLIAEALDVVQGGGAGLRKLSERYAELGAHPLLAVAMAERLVQQWNFTAAVPLFDRALKGNLLGLRRPGSVALAAADAASRAEAPEHALRFMELAQTDSHTRTQALRRIAQFAAAGGDVERSRSSLRELARSAEGEERARTLAQLGRALFTSQDVEDRAEAVHVFIEAIEAAPEESGLHLQLQAELTELRRRQSFLPKGASDPPNATTLHPAARPSSVPPAPVLPAVHPAEETEETEEKEEEEEPIELTSANIIASEVVPAELEEAHEEVHEEIVPAEPESGHAGVGDSGALAEPAASGTPTAGSGDVLGAHHPTAGSGDVLGAHHPTAGSGDMLRVRAEAARTLEDLSRALTEAANPRDRALARVALARARAERGEGPEAEKLLAEALAEGSVEAGEILCTMFESVQGRTADLLRVRHTLADMRPGDLSRLDALAAAALADHNPTYARAVEHVARAFDPGAGPLPPPPLGVQNEQPGMLRLLARHSHETAGEALALVWEGAGAAFAKSAAHYNVTGMERIALGPTSALSRVYDVALRLLDSPPTPLFVKRAQHPLTFSVALLTPAAAILSGDAREDAPLLRHILGQAISATLPQNALLMGLPERQARIMWNAVLGAFGPPELGRELDIVSGQMAEQFWQLIAHRTQRRLKELLAQPQRTDFDLLRERARQSGRRMGLFLTGDFGFAGRALVEEQHGDTSLLTTPAGLLQACAEYPSLVDLYRLAIRPEYADARWRAAPPSSHHPSSGRMRVR